MSSKSSSPPGSDRSESTSPPASAEGEKLLRSSLSPLLSVIALCLPSTQALAAPLAVRDQNPLLSGFDLPGPLPATLHPTRAWTLDASFAWGSSALIQTTARESLIVDAETREVRFSIGRTFAKGYALQIELPYRHTSAGRLDSFIDGWHDFFSLPEGARPALPRDSLRITYERDGRRSIDERSSQSGLGDVALRVGKHLSPRAGTAPVTAWLGIKLPTGDADALTGSGSIDVSAALAGEYSFGDRYTLYAQAAGTLLGDGDRLRAQQKDIAWSALVGIDARVFQRLTLAAQFDAHTAVFDSATDFLGDAVTLTLGGAYRISSAWELSFAVTEDIAVDTAPDVVFLLQLKRAVP